MVRKLRRSLQVVSKPYNEDDFYHQPGTIPGTIIIPPDASPPKITLIDYHATGDVIRKELKIPE